MQLAGLFQNKNLSERAISPNSKENNSSISNGLFENSFFSKLQNEITANKPYPANSYNQNEHYAIGKQLTNTFDYYQKDQYQKIDTDKLAKINEKQTITPEKESTKNQTLTADDKPDITTEKQNRQNQDVNRKQPEDSSAENSEQLKNLDKNKEEQVADKQLEDNPLLAAELVASTNNNIEKADNKNHSSKANKTSKQSSNKNGSAKLAKTGIADSSQTKEKSTAKVAATLNEDTMAKTLTFEENTDKDNLTSAKKILSKTLETTELSKELTNNLADKADLLIEKGNIGFNRNFTGQNKGKTRKKKASATKIQPAFIKTNVSRETIDLKNSAFLATNKLDKEKFIVSKENNENSQNNSSDKSGQFTFGKSFINNIKTATATQPTELRQYVQQQASQLLQRAKIIIHNKENANLTTQLYPKELGKITVNLALIDGVLHGRFLVENDAIKNELLAQVEKLMSEMKEQGTHIEKFTVDVRQEQSTAGESGNKNKFEQNNKPLVTEKLVSDIENYNGLATSKQEGQYA